MTTLLRNICISSATVILLYSCTSGDPFTDEELKWFRPFKNIDTCIYVSENGLRDTIIFFGIDTVSAKLRNLEQGFRDERTLQIIYTLTKGSFHQFVSPSGNNEPESFLSVTDIDNWTRPVLELSFLGSVYDNSFFDKARGDNQRVVHFDQAKSSYQGVNLSEGIKSFDFDLEKGVVGFIDKFDRKWWLKN